MGLGGRNLGTCTHTKMLNYETNVLVPVRISELSLISNANIFFAIWSVINFGVNIVLLIINWGGEILLGDLAFHIIEFSFSFIFSVIQLLAVFFSYDHSDMCKRPILLKMIVFINLVGSFVPMLLVILNLER